MPSVKGAYRRIRKARAASPPTLAEGMSAFRESLTILARKRRRSGTGRKWAAWTRAQAQAWTKSQAKARAAVAANHGPNRANLGEDRPRTDLENEVGQKEASRAAQEQPGWPPNRAGRAGPDLPRPAGQAPGDRGLGLPQCGFVVDVDPEKISDRPGPGLSLRRQRPDAAGEREISFSLAFRERLEQCWRAEEDPRVEGVEVGDVLPDGGDTAGLVADPGHVVEVHVGMALDPRVHGQDDLVRRRSRSRPGP